MRFTLQTVKTSTVPSTIPVLEVTAPSKVPAALLLRVLPNPFYSKIRWISEKMHH